MSIMGLRHTDNFVTNARPENWREMIMLLYPNSAEAAKAPLTALTSMMKSRSLDDPIFHWWEKVLDSRRIVLTANLTTSNDTITVASRAQTLKRGDVLMVEQTREVMHVLADPTSDTSITVQRGVGNSGTGVTVDYDGAGINPNLLVIGSAFEEGSMAPSGINFDPNERYNYMQIFRSTLEITRTASKTRLRTGDQVKEAKRECLEYVGVDMERGFWFGKRDSKTLNGKPARFTAGVYDQIVSNAPTNIKSFTAAGVDMDEFEEEMYNCFLYGSSEKMVIGGNRALSTINTIVRKNSSYQIHAGEKEYGMKVTRLVTPFGELVFKGHPLFTQSGAGSTGGTAYYGLSAEAAVLDMANISYVHLTDSDLKYEPELAATGIDGMKSGYIAECGIELNHADTHRWWKDLAIGIADD